MIDQLAERYREEEKRLKTVRLLSWCSVGRLESVLGIACDLLTARALVDLQLAENSIVTGSYPTQADAAAYLWRVSAAYRPGDGWRARRGKKRAIKAVYKAGKIKSVVFTQKHADESFAEIPITGGLIKSSGRKDFPDVDGIVSAVEEVAARYGQNPDTVFDWPLVRIFQLQKAARLATIPDYKLRKPETLMNIRREYLTELNK